MNIIIWMGYCYMASNKILPIKNQKLLYQHSEIAVLISLMTPYPSTSLFLATGLCPCLVSLCMPSITYFSRWQHERMRISNKLWADTVLHPHSKNTWFVCQNVFLWCIIMCIILWHLYWDMYHILRACIIAALKITPSRPQSYAIFAVFCIDHLLHFADISSIARRYTAKFLNPHRGTSA